MGDIGEPWDEMMGDLLAHEKARPDPSPEVQARVLGRLATAFQPIVPGPRQAGRAEPVPSATVPEAVGKTAGVPRILRLRTLAVFLAGAGAGVVADRTYRRVERPIPAVQHRAVAAADGGPGVAMAVQPPPSGPLEPERAPETVKANVQAPPPAPRANRQRRESEGARPPPPLPPPVGADRGLAAERNLLEIARSALMRKQPELALDALGRHAQRFPDGELLEEREGLWVLALISKGDYPLGREHAARFLAQFPRSLLAPAVEEAVRSIP